MFYLLLLTRILLLNIVVIPQDTSFNRKEPNKKVIDACVNWDNNTAYFFKNGEYVKFDVKKDAALQGYPKKMDQNSFPGVWENGIDAVINWGNGKVYFFKGNQYIRFDIAKHKSDPSYPKPINEETWPGLWKDGVDAAVNWGNGKAYFIKNNEYVRYDIKSGTPDAGFPKEISNETWPGYKPKKVDAAFCFKNFNNKAYVFFSDEYYRYDLKSGSVDLGYPKKINSVSWKGVSFSNENSISYPQGTYKQILSEGIKAGISADYKFPLTQQYQNGCFAFGVNHILEYKYSRKIDLYEAEKKINKPRSELWSRKHIKNFLDEYNIEMEWFSDANKFFKLLSEGEPVLILYRKYYSDTQWVGHFVAVYSFDKGGVWISESVAKERLNLPYSYIFDSSGKKTKSTFGIVTKFN